MSNAVNTKTLTEETLENVQRHLYLTSVANPAVAKVVDVKSVKEKDPVFFANVKVDDVLLVVDSKAILYRPDTDIIINVAPVTIQQKQEVQKQEKRKQKPDYRTMELNWQVDVLNGSNDVKAVAKIQSSVKTFNRSLSPKDIGIANRNFMETVVYDNSSNPVGVKELATFLGYKYEKGLPDGIKTSADVLIVAGFDRFKP